jgi:hypothetical protein
MCESFVNPVRIPDSKLPKGWVFCRSLSDYNDIDFSKNYNFVYYNEDADVMVMVACDAVDDDFGISVDAGRSPMVFTQLSKTKSAIKANDTAIEFMNCISHIE